MSSTSTRVLECVRLAAAWFAAAATFFAGCSAPKKEASTLAGRAAVFDSVSKALTYKKCEDAVLLIDTVYNSDYTDNEARLLRAAAYGCMADINFFDLIEALAANELSGSAFWITMTKLFPSEDGDSKVESSWEATDALLATLEPGKVVSSANQVNADTKNPGSLLSSDRVNNANAYLLFISMATIGGLQNRFGAPNATSYKKTQDLTWGSSHTKVDINGCSYTAAILNLLDALQELALNASRLSKALEPVLTLKSLMDQACKNGCDLCYLSKSDTSLLCDECPMNMRDRTSCGTSTDAAPDREACASFGIVQFINLGGDFGWPTEGT